MRLIDADAFKQYVQEGYETTKEMFHGKYRELVDAVTKGLLNDIDEQPTIEPQRWIPVTERLPEEDGEYLVANLTIKGKPCVYGIDTFANDLYQVDKYDFSDKKGKRGWVFFHDEYGYLEDKTVVAWMPLPTPYKGE